MQKKGSDFWDDILKGPKIISGKEAKSMEDTVKNIMKIRRKCPTPPFRAEFGRTLPSTGGFSGHKENEVFLCTGNSKNFQVCQKCFIQHLKVLVFAFLCIRKIIL